MSWKQVAGRGTWLGAAVAALVRLFRPRDAAAHAMMRPPSPAPLASPGGIAPA